MILESAVAGEPFGRFPDSNGRPQARPGLTRDARGGSEMATVFTPQTEQSTKVRFAHRFKMVVTKPSNPTEGLRARRFVAEAPDAGHTRRGSEAGEMWTRNAEAPDAGYGR